MRTEKISTPSGVRLVTHPVTNYGVVYRNHRVNVPAKTATAIRQVTESRVETVTRRVTVVETTTAVSTKTITLPITVTVTVPELVDWPFGEVRRAARGVHLPGACG